MSVKTVLWAKSKNSKVVSEFICEYDGYLTLQDDVIQNKIEQMENIGFHSFSTSAEYD